METYYEYASLVCPEGHGTTELTIHVLEHTTNREKQAHIDKRAVTQVDCDVQSSLLKNNRNCNCSCRETSEYKSIKEEILRIDNQD